jgi:hypothetical protein
MVNALTPKDAVSPTVTVFGVVREPQANIFPAARVPESKRAKYFISPQLLTELAAKVIAPELAIAPALAVPHKPVVATRR